MKTPKQNRKKPRNRVGSKELVRRLSCAKVIIRDLLSLAPSPACELFHHDKKDQHTWSEPCPCVVRYNARLKAATDFLSSPNADVSQPDTRPDQT